MRVDVNGTRLWFPDGLGELTVIEGAGHLTRLDSPERFWPTIVGFVERATGRR
jgi:pimeloyl-ACP methyl ester carboxylesterase